MEYTLDLGAWNAVFAVPCSLVDRHIKLAGKEQLQAILWILRHAGESFTPEELAEELAMSVDSALDSLEYWADRGLLAEHSGALHPVPQPKAERKPTAAQPAEAPAAQAEQQAAKAAPAEPAPAKLPPKRRMAKPDTGYLAARLNESAEIRALLDEAQAVLGILSPAMTAVLLASCDDYGLPAEVVLMLIHYAKEVGKTGTTYIDSVARDWAESGVFTVEAAEQKLQELSEKSLAWSRVSSAAGLPKRAPGKKEEEAAYRWVYEWNFSQEMLAAAYERCADNTGKFSAAYMNKVLESWHKQGIKNLQQLSDLEAQRGQQSNNSGERPASFDIDEVERLSFFDLPEGL